MTTYSGSLRGDGLRVAIVCGRFNDFITERLRRWLRRKYGTSGMYARWPDSVLVERYGLYELRTATS